MRARGGGGGWVALALPALPALPALTGATAGCSSGTHDHGAPDASVDVGPAAAPTLASAGPPRAAERVAQLRARFVVKASAQPDHPRLGAPSPVARPVIDEGVVDRFEPAEGGRLRPIVRQLAKRGPLRTASVWLPTSAAHEVEVEDDATHVAVRFSLVGAQRTRVETADGIAVYRGALDGEDVLHRVHAEGTEDFVVFERKPVVEEIAYEVDVSRVAGLRLVGATVEFLDATGAPRLRVSPPYVIDARGARHPATLAIEGCAYDASPAAPWGRGVTAPGAARCGVRVRWHDLEYPAVVDPAWTATGSMAVARRGLTLSVLGSGYVLAAGGFDTTWVANAELYDAASGTFAATGSMVSARAGHTANLLGSGKVLIAGGVGSTYFASAELYDPASGTFAPTGSMASARDYHAASVLGSGEVLVTGGETTGKISLSLAELYDPASGTFRATGAMAVARRGLTASVLASGKVLVAGGYDGAITCWSAELYDPASGTFAPTGSMRDARSAHTASVLGSGKVLVAGGGIKGGYVSTAELYDPTAGTFSPTGPLVRSRLEHTASVLVSGKVLLVGGNSASGTPSVAELYDPPSGTFMATGPLVVVRRWHAASVLSSGKVLVAGGYDSPTNRNLSAAEVFDPVATAGACSGPGDCLSGHCVDGYCCDSACASICQTCAATPGTCTVVKSAIDADTCAAGSSCDASGRCVKNNGAACSLPDECATGHCADGVCCDAACVGACVACTAARKGKGADGACGDVAADTDPRDACPRDATFPSSCKGDGLCDGAGACRRFALPTVACGGPSCIGDTVSVELCDGSGSCVRATPVDCAPFRCTAGACTTSCSVDGDCASFAYCMAAKTCSTKRARGAACATDLECATGFCVDGVCCDQACMGLCQACADAGSAGTCVAVKGKPRGARGDCAGASTSCYGACDGSNTAACGFPTGDTSCGAGCADGKHQVCDGAGPCLASSSCAGNFACDGATKCKSSCAADADCAAGFICTAGECAPKPSATCSADGSSSILGGDAGPPQACAPYRCIRGGTCGTQCATKEDCAAGNTCDTSVPPGRCAPAAAAAAHSSGGCGIGAVGSDAGIWVSLVALALVVASRRRPA